MAGRDSTALVLKELGETLPSIDGAQLDCLVDELMVSSFSIGVMCLITRTIYL